MSKRLVSCILATALAGFGLTATASEPAPAPLDTVFTQNGDRIVGTILGTTENKWLRIEGSQFKGPVSIDLSLVMRIESNLRPPTPTGSRISLTNGDYVLGELKAVNAEKADLVSSEGEPMTFRVALLAAVTFAVRQPTAASRPTVQPGIAGPGGQGKGASEDSVQIKLTNGDSVAAQSVLLDNGHWTIKTAFGDLTPEPGNVDEIRFLHKAKPSPPPPKFVRVRAADYQLTFDSCEVFKDRLVVHSAQYGTMTLLHGSVLSIQFEWGATPDWTLQFSDAFHRPELGKDWAITNGAWSIENWVLTDGGWSHEEDMLSGHGTIMCTRKFTGSQRLEFDATTNTPCDLSGILCANADGETSGYFFGFGSENNAYSKLLILGQQARQYAAVITPGKVHHIVCERDGSMLRHIIDGQVVMTCTDPAPLNGPDHDMIGFYIFRSGKIFNVKVFTKPEKTTIGSNP